MARFKDLSTRTINTIKSMLKDGYSNIAIAKKLKKYKVTEKNIRDWKANGLLKIDENIAEKKISEKHEKDYIEPKKVEVIATEVVKEDIEQVAIKEDIKPKRKDKEIKNIKAIKDEKIILAVIEAVVKSNRKIKVLKSLEKQFNLTRAEAEFYYGRALTELVNSIPKDIEAIYAMHIEARLDDIKKLREQGKIMDAHRIMQDLARLQGLYPTESAISIANNKSDEIIIEVPEEYKQYLPNFNKED